MTGGEEVKRKGVIHVSGVNRSSSLGSTHTHSVCASQHVFPIWFHPVPQHWLNADLFSLIFLLSHVLLFCSFFSSQSTSLPPLSLLSLSLSPAIPHVISLSPLTLISYPRLPLLFISVTQHLDLMLFLRCGFVLCVCVFDSVMSSLQLSPARYHRDAVISHLSHLLPVILPPVSLKITVNQSFNIIKGLKVPFVLHKGGNLWMRVRSLQCCATCVMTYFQSRASLHTFRLFNYM